MPLEEGHIKLLNKIWILLTSNGQFLEQSIKIGLAVESLKYIDGIGTYLWKYIEIENGSFEVSTFNSQKRLDF